MQIQVLYVCIKHLLHTFYEIETLRNLQLRFSIRGKNNLRIENFQSENPCDRWRKFIQQY